MWRFVEEIPNSSRSRFPVPIALRGPHCSFASLVVWASAKVALARVMMSSSNFWSKREKRRARCPCDGEGLEASAVGADMEGHGRTLAESTPGRVRPRKPNEVVPNEVLCEVP